MQLKENSSYSKMLFDKKKQLLPFKAPSIFIFILHYTFGSFKLWTFYDEYYTII